ncbi:MAG: PorP/SprF family type IX secretion system membrane protein [Cyclobacteriaceae bacterium]|nr:PorP/SprF family type IX secretion system membrane protein [Cyclobacteriaceae bacterium]
MHRIVFFGILFCISLTSFSQQNEIYNQFYMNPYLYNPAYAGVEGHSVLFLMYHNQWANIEGAPQLSHVTFHTPLKAGVGVGATAYNLSHSIINKSIGKVSASYLVTIDRKHYLRFGMSVGGGTQQLNFGELDDPTDVAFQGIVNQSSFLVADFGATYHFDHFNLGFSIPNLVSHDVFSENAFSTIRVKPLDNLLVKANYRGHINDDIAIEPHVLYRYNHYAPDQFEATVILHIYHLIWLGTTYRQSNNFIATFGTKIKERIGIGYAFDMGNTAISGLLGPTHEVHIGIHVGTRKEHAEHVSSFIKSHRLTPEERERKAALEREQQLKALQASRQTQVKQDDDLSIVGTKTTPDTLKTEEPKVEEPVVEEPKVEEPKVEKRVVEEPKVEEPKVEKPVVEEPKVEEPKIEERVVEEPKVEEPKVEERVVEEPKVEEPKIGEPVVEEPKVEEPKIEEPVVEEPKVEEPKIEGPKVSSTHTEVQRGNHMLELPVGNYLVIGAFKDFDEAEELSDRLFQRGYHEALVGYVSQNGAYHVIIYRSDSLEKAISQKNIIKNRTGMSNLKVLKVTE